MSFTDKENNVMKEKLMDVQTPPVEDAWAKMSEILGPPPIQAASSGILGKVKHIYLNVFIGVFVISSALFLHSAVKKHDNVSLKVETKPSQITSARNIIHSAFPTNDDSKAASVPPKKPEMKAMEPEDMVQTNILSSNNISTTNTQEVAQNYDAPTEVQSELILEKKISKYLPYPENDDIELEEENEDRWTTKSSYQNSIFGIRLGMQVFPDVKLSQVNKTFSGGVFYREYLNPNRAIQLEALYNPIMFRPITYVETSMNNGNVLRDSSLVNHSRQISVPLQFYFQGDNQLNFMVGAQYSYVMSVQGERYRITKNSSGTDEVEMEYATINNQNAFIKHDVAFVVEFNYQAFERISFGFRVQQSLRDQTKSKLGMNEHRHGALQFKTSFILR